MINPMNYNDIFNKNKKYIVEILINYYGQEYSEVIKKRLENVFFDFSSTPEDDYMFVKNYDVQVSDSDKELIKLRYEQYQKIKKESFESSFKALLEYIKNVFSISDSDMINVEWDTFSFLFTDKNFNSELIDAYSSKSINLLNDSSIADSIKESIIYDQENFKMYTDSLGIKLENFSTENVDKIIEYRKKLQTIYKNNIVQKSEFGKNINDRIRKKFGIELTLENLSTIAFFEDPWAGNIKVVNGNDVVYYPIIKIPLIHLINYGGRAFDVNLIHEMIHKAEANGDYVGISIHDEYSTNSIINETRTQMAAIKLTKQLHQLGIFIFDNPNNYKIEGVATYEMLFPLTNEFLTQNEEVISNCAINNTPHKLNEYFGNYWGDFSKEISNIYYDHMRYISRIQGMPNIRFNDKIAELINNMEMYKRSGIKRV